jgi:hypothetical protein
LAGFTSASMRRTPSVGEELAAHRLQRLAHQPLAPVGAGEHVTQLEALAAGVVLEEQQRADHGCVGPAHDDELLPGARGAERLHAREPGRAVVQRQPGGVGQELRHLRVAVDGQQRRQVRRGHRPQGDPVGLDVRDQREAHAAYASISAR